MYTLIDVLLSFLKIKKLYKNHTKMACLNENVTSYIGYINFTYTEGFLILLDCKGFLRKQREKLCGRFVLW